MAIGVYGETPAFKNPPYPKISRSLFVILEKAIRLAWERLRARTIDGFDLATAQEDRVTHELHEILYDEIFDTTAVAGFNAMAFRSIQREGKFRTFDGSSLDKMPDMHVTLHDRPAGIRKTQDGIFVECKPVGPSRSVHTHYCKKGIVRFLKGEYAWTLTAALMVGYASTGYAASTALKEALEAVDMAPSTLDYPHACDRSEDVQITRHSRSFKYVETGTDAPPIVVRHLWLARD